MRFVISIALFLIGHMVCAGPGKEPQLEWETRRSGNFVLSVTCSEILNDKSDRIKSILSSLDWLMESKRYIGTRGGPYRKIKYYFKTRLETYRLVFQLEKKFYNAFVNTSQTVNQTNKPDRMKTVLSSLDWLRDLKRYNGRKPDTGRKPNAGIDSVDNLTQRYQKQKADQLNFSRSNAYLANVVNRNGNTRPRIYSLSKQVGGDGIPETAEKILYYFIHSKEPPPNRGLADLFEVTSSLADTDGDYKEGKKEYDEVIKIMQEVRSYGKVQEASYSLILSLQDIISQLQTLKVRFEEANLPLSTGHYNLQLESKWGIGNEELIPIRSLRDLQKLISKLKQRQKKLLGNLTIVNAHLGSAGYFKTLYRKIRWRSLGGEIFQHSKRQAHNLSYLYYLDETLAYQNERLQVEMAAGASNLESALQKIEWLRIQISALVKVDQAREYITRYKKFIKSLGAVVDTQDTASWEESRWDNQFSQENKELNDFWLKVFKPQMARLDVESFLNLTSQIENELDQILELIDLAESGELTPSKRGQIAYLEEVLTKSLNMGANNSGSDHTASGQTSNLFRKARELQADSPLLSGIYSTVGSTKSLLDKAFVKVKVLSSLTAKLVTKVKTVVFLLTSLVVTIGTTPLGDFLLETGSKVGWVSALINKKPAELAVELASGVAEISSSYADKVNRCFERDSRSGEFKGDPLQLLSKLVSKTYPPIYTDERKSSYWGAELIIEEALKKTSASPLDQLAEVFAESQKNLSSKSVKNAEFVAGLKLAIYNIIQLNIEVAEIEQASPLTQLLIAVSKHPGDITVQLTVKIAELNALGLHKQSQSVRYVRRIESIAKGLSLDERFAVKYTKWSQATLELYLLHSKQASFRSRLNDQAAMAKENGLQTILTETQNRLTALEAREQVLLLAEDRALDDLMEYMNGGVEKSLSSQLKLAKKQLKKAKRVKQKKGLAQKQKSPLELKKEQLEVSLAGLKKLKLEIAAMRKVLRQENKIHGKIAALVSDLANFHTQIEIKSEKNIAAEGSEENG